VRVTKKGAMGFNRICCLRPEQLIAGGLLDEEQPGPYTPERRH